VYQEPRYRSSVLYSGDPRRSHNTARALAAHVNWEIVAGFVIVLGFLSFVLATGNEVWRVPGTILLVIVGWIFSLCLHEFAHAATAFLGGDRSDSTATYLSFNPLKYLHPILSILLPVVFILLGGIGLPGGAVYLRRDLVRSRGWQSAISAAGPAMNVLTLVVIAIPFALGVLDAHPLLAEALGLLAFFQAAATVLNLLPIPGLDGYGIIEPWLPYSWRAALAPFRGYGILILFVLLWTLPQFNELYFTSVTNLMAAVRIDPIWFALGYSTFNTIRPHL
jgi:Zn-dependent protease